MSTPSGASAAGGPSRDTGTAEPILPASDHQASQRQAIDRETVVAREKERYGGMKFGSAFFGWLTATGMTLLLTALLAAAGTAIGLATDTDLGQAAGQATQGGQTAQTVGIAGGIALLVILLLAYFCGGYVAGRMARFNGARQGVAVWLWAVLIAVAVAVLGLVAGSQFDVLSQLNSLPRIPVNAGDLTTGGIITLVAAAGASLLGAVLGGLAGMRFHRKVDKAGLGR
ncbi:MAG: hypothetical protein M3Q47_09610 [Actinomycetota bacterium]|nr:hypothetical protein [Actinomycetota bacterium]